MAEVEVWRGGVAAWECDAFGHLNIGFYVAKAMEALAGLAAELGMADAFSPEANATLLVRDQYIRFLREARPNAALSMTGGVIEMRESDARLLLLMRHASGELAATFQMVVTHATARDGCVFGWADRHRHRAEALTVEVPAEAQPRSLSLTTVETAASLERAESLDLLRIGLGAVRPADCDAFGRMRAEHFMTRISDGVPHLLGPQRPGGGEGRRIGGAALEYRLLHHAWPRAGDRVELRSGLAGTDAKVRRMVHWMVDPASGRPWATAEAIAASFDLDSRRIVTLDEDETARLRKGVVEGLTL